MDQAQILRNRPVRRCLHRGLKFLDVLRRQLRPIDIDCQLVEFGGQCEWRHVIGIVNAGLRIETNINSQLAQLLLRQGRQPEAIPVLRDIISANPSDQDVRITLALALLPTGDPSGAKAEIDLLRAAAPYRAEVLLPEGLLLVSSGDPVAARKMVREIVKRYPNLRLPPQLEALSRLP